MKKFSKQRELILNSLKSRKDHPTAETLFWDLKKEMPNLGIATIYRNLQNLYKEGEIAKIKTKDGIDRYDGNIKTATSCTFIKFHINPLLIDTFYYDNNSNIQKNKNK